MAEWDQVRVHVRGQMHRQLLDQVWRQVANQLLDQVRAPIWAETS